MTKNFYLFVTKPSFEIFCRRFSLAESQYIALTYPKLRDSYLRRPLSVAIMLNAINDVVPASVSSANRLIKSMPLPAKYKK